MATPMQYELLNAIIGMWNGGFRFPVTADVPRKYANGTLEAFASMALDRSVGLVDVNDIARSVRPQGLVPRNEVVLAGGEVRPAPTDHWVSAFDRNYCREALRPYWNRPVTDIPMPWPAALFVAEVYESDGPTAWAFRGTSTGWRAYAFAIGLSKKYGLWVGSIDDRTVTASLEDGSPIGEAMNYYSFIAAISLSLASAKNARWVESTPNRSTRRRNPSVAGIRFRHIEIDMGKPKRTGDQRQTEAHGVPWHHRRGHWAHYSADRPLFGRKGQHGWYWRPYTEVGDKAHGEIVQDYSVKANLPAEAA
jgi:hypothetical protein